MIFTVGYVHSDESTPRDEYFVTVNAVDYEDAKVTAWAELAKDGERIQITGVMTDSAAR